MQETSLCPSEGLSNIDPNRSTKKVKIRKENDQEGLEEVNNMEVEIMDNPPAIVNEPTEKVSFKDTLLNNTRTDHSIHDEDYTVFNLLDDDIEVGDNKGVPTINFSDRIHNLIAQNMRFCVVVRLLGKTIGYKTLLSRLLKLWKPKDYPSLVDLDNNFFLVRFYSMDDYINALSGGPWVIFGHYLTVQPWNPEFSSDNINATSVTAWVRFPGLPIQYYHNHVLKAIAKTIGNVIKIDFNTEARERCKFARLAINLDLTKPLFSRIMIDGHIQKVEYEGLPIICFDCGQYGHRKNLCPHKQSTNGVTDGPTTIHAGPSSVSPSTMEDAPFGPWMQVTNRRRKPDFSANNQGSNGNKSSGSRFDAIATLEDHDHGQSSTHGNKNNVAPAMQKETLNFHAKKISNNKVNVSNTQGKSLSHNINASTNMSTSSSHMQGHAKANVSHLPTPCINGKVNVINNSSSTDIIPSPVDVSLDPKSHSAVVFSPPRNVQDQIPQLKLLSLREKFPPKGSDKTRSQWSVKINKNSKNSIKTKKKKAPNLMHNTNIGDLLMEMNIPESQFEDTGAISEGAAKNGFVRSVKSFRDYYNPSIMVVVEPRIAGIKADKVIKRTGFDFSHRVEAHGFSGGIWLLWNVNAKVDILLNHFQFIHISLTFDNTGETFLFTAVYGSPSPSNRNNMWRDLSSLNIGNNFPWIIAGDFNAILYSTDRKGGSRFRNHGCPHFSNFLEKNALTQLDSVGPNFTWRWGNLFQKLDRAICNNLWLQKHLNAVTHHLPRIHSDHRPILIKLNTHRLDVVNNKPFRFLASWLTHKDFVNVVKNSWNNQQSLNDNIHLFTEKIKGWNVDVFGNIFKQKRILLARINGIQRYLENRPSNYLTELENNLKAELDEISLREEALWLQKSRCNWLMLGDRNTSYFHAKATARRRRNRICVLKDSDGNWCDNDASLRNLAVYFFKGLYTESCNNRPVYQVRGCFPALDSITISRLDSEITNGEIHQALFQMQPWKALGVDGIPAAFYQNQWVIVGNSICSTIRNIFKEGVMESDINRTLISLIPKTEKPETIKDFRPISLCTVVYKILTKVIANRFKKFMPSIVRPTQASFVAGRNITDNIIIAQEVIHSMRNKKGKESWFAIKVDLEKAYDCLNWKFIEDTLTDVGIPTHMIKVIMHCISSSHMSLLWNGTSSEEFKPSRGIRQGDPLSPYIFVLCMERLSHRIDLSIQNDDLVLFGKATEGQGLIVKSILDEFSKSSGLSCAVNISSLLGFQRSHDLGKYLGVPLLHSRITKETYAFILDKIHKKLSGWNANLLSLAGRLTLAKSVLMTIPSYTMQTAPLPKSLCNSINSLVRNFIWGSKEGSRKHCLIKWEDMCTPCTSGGSGIRDLKRQNNAFIMKLGFSVMTKPELLWVQVVRSKYGWIRNGNSCKAGANNSVLWRNISQLWGTIVSGCSWALGDGSEVKFWDDNWLNDLGPLKLLSISPIAESDLSLKVKDLVVNGNWDWGRLSCQVPNTVLLHLAAVNPPSAVNGTDQLFWSSTSSGNISVSSAYDIQGTVPCDANQRYWKAIWSWPGAQRVRILLWLGANNKLLTNHERKRRHMTEDASCSICGDNVEDGEHIFRSCIMAREVWRKLLSTNAYYAFFNLPFTDWFFGNLQGKIVMDAANWIVTFGITCWCL
ncbi:uncharacterized protein LOC126667366 [Mercurialis annua]|uniref:uncharacterized protein LOC126667366 n=1 Tax=Mercurialis annua TaxID=3986 RepID=UPI0024AE0D19|nr:uncharacterized protein LOC126667366 [Mercurialis annua]